MPSDQLGEPGYSRIRKVIPGACILACVLRIHFFRFVLRRAAGVLGGGSQNGGDLGGDLGGDRLVEGNCWFRKNLPGLAWIFDLFVNADCCRGK